MSPSSESRDRAGSAEEIPGRATSDRRAHEASESGPHTAELVRIALVGIAVGITWLRLWEPFPRVGLAEIGGGYLMWLFRPVRGGIWKDVADDATLLPDGTREPPCPVAPVPPTGSVARKTVYRFGVSASLRH